MGRSNKKEMLKKTVKASLTVAPALVLGASFMGYWQVAEAAAPELHNIPGQLLVGEVISIPIPSGYYINFSVDNFEKYPELINGIVEVSFSQEGTYMINLMSGEDLVTSYPVVVNNHAIRAANYANHPGDGKLDIRDIVKYNNVTPGLDQDDINAMLQRISSFYATGNQAPIYDGDLSLQQSYYVGDEKQIVLYFSSEQTHMDYYFSDDDHDALTYTVDADDRGIADVWIDYGVVHIKSKKMGSTNIIITAHDGLGKSVSEKFLYKVIENSAPLEVPGENGNPLWWHNEEWIFYVGEPRIINMSPYFIDPDNHILTYKWKTDSDEDIENLLVNVDFDGSMMKITPNISDNNEYPDEQDIFIEVNDGHGGVIVIGITIVVNEVT